MVSEPPRPSVVTSSELVRHALEARDQHDLAAVERLADAVRLDLEDARLGVGAVGHDPRLRAGQRDRLVAEVVDHHRGERAGDALAGREQHVHLARVGARGDLVRERHQLVGVAGRARRGPPPRALPSSARRDDALGGALDPLRVGDRGAAELHDHGVSGMASKDSLRVAWPG